MDGLLGHLLRCDEFRNRQIREVIAQRGFKEVYTGKTDNWELTFDEFSILTPGSLIIIGYDKDLDCNGNRLMHDYKCKENADSATVYSMDLDDMVRDRHIPTRETEINGRKAKLPFLSPDTAYIPLPIERSGGGLFFSMSKEVKIPTELMSRMYVAEKNKRRLLKQHLMSYCGFSANYGPRSEPQCEGEMTLPIPLIVVNGKKGIEYLYTGKALSENIGTLGKVIGADKDKNSQRNKVAHNRRFIAKYQPLLKGLK